jgi:hypothetical protein
MLILYDYDSNSILSAPMKNRGDKEMVRAFDLLIQSLILRGLKPLLQYLDNEASLALKNYLTKQGITSISPRRTFTEEITQNGQYKHSRIISLPGSALWIQISPETLGQTISTSDNYAQPPVEITD